MTQAARVAVCLTLTAVMTGGQRAAASDSLSPPDDQVTSARVMSARATSGWGAEQLMRMLGQVEAADLTFVEQRSSVFLIDEIILTGSMSYRAPDRIEKHVETPFVENLKINGDRLSIEKVSDRGESSIKTYSLQSLDSIGTAVEGIHATLSGNLDSLHANYDVQMNGNVENWQVMLVPRRAEVREIIEKISVSGNDSKIRVIETQDADGDGSTLTLSYQMIR